MELDKKRQIRNKSRFFSKIDLNVVVIGIIEKFTNEKDADVLYEMLNLVENSILQKIHFYIVVDDVIHLNATIFAKRILETYGVITTFVEMKDQPQIVYYLAMDILILPSKIDNCDWIGPVYEAVNGGCSIVLNDSLTFDNKLTSLERFKFFTETDSENLAVAISHLGKYKRSFEWASQLNHSQHKKTQPC